MDIQSGYYEAGIVLFWLLFAYLFMDKFLFKGQLGEICFGKARRRMAKALRSVAGWFDPVKEVQKKERKRTKGKTEKKEIPVVREAEKRDMPAAKTLHLLAETRKQRHKRQHKCRLNAYRNCSGTSVWKSGGLPEPTVPAGLRIKGNGLETVTTWIRTN